MSYVLKPLNLKGMKNDSIGPNNLMAFMNNINKISDV